MPRWPGFVGGSDTPQSLIADSEQTYNLYVEPLPRSGKNMGALFPSPGFRSWSATGSDVGFRGAINANGRLFVAFGMGLWEFTAAGVATRRGSIAVDSNPVQFVYNGVVGNQLGICAGGAIYSYDLSTDVLTPSGILTAGFTHLAYANGSGLAFNPTTGKVYPSSLNDLSTYDLANFFRRSLFPDPWQAMFVDPNNLVWLLGTDTFEVWYYGNPASTQPFAPLSGLTGQAGIAAPFAYWVSSLGQGWLSVPQGGLQVVATKGAVPDPVSTYAVTTALGDYRRSVGIDDAEAFVYQDDGHCFASLSCQRANATWTLDAVTKSWTQRGPWNTRTGAYDVWSPRGHVYAFGKHLVGDRSSGTLWEMDRTFTTEMDGSPIRRLRRTPGLTDEQKRHPIDQVALLMDVGVAGQNVNPLATMRMSDDGGRTWSNEQQASFGRIGQYGQRVYWNRLGAPPDAVLECVWTADAPVRVIDAWINGQEGPSLGRAA